jgi:hypothetical protein
MIEYDKNKTYTPEEQAANRATLCEALRSGKYQHAKGYLKNVNGGMCCLGVGLDLVAPEGWLYYNANGFGHIYSKFGGPSKPKETIFSVIYGIDGGHQDRLAVINDRPDTLDYLKQIEYIEKLK